MKMELQDLRDDMVVKRVGIGVSAGVGDGVVEEVSA